MERGKVSYLEIYVNLHQGKTNFSITTKEGVEQYLDFCKRGVGLGNIVIGSFSNIAFRWVDLSVWYIVPWFTENPHVGGSILSPVAIKTYFLITYTLFINL